MTIQDILHLLDDLDGYFEFRCVNCGRLVKNGKLVKRGKKVKKESKKCL